MKTEKKKRSYDPSKTSSIRNAFVRDLNKRFNKLLSELVYFIVKQDVFGLSLGKKRKKVLSVNVQRYQYAFKKDSEKVEEFLKWLEKQSEQNILSIIKTGRQGPGLSYWSDVYIESAYKQGMKRGMEEIESAVSKIPKKDRNKLLRKFNLSRFPLEDKDAYISASFFSPVHSDAVGLIYTRTFMDLKGITQTMATKMSQILAQGLIDGRAPLAVAKELSNELNISRRRARTIARTEIIRAHHEANINVYEEAKIKDVKIQSEWLTARDDRVCSRCSRYDGRRFSLNRIRGMIPVHPNCRCVALPVVEI